jgi:broad specificity phosphatase PhoE
LPRAYQTAEVLGEVLGLEPEQDPDLVEFIPGDIDGSTWDEWREQHGFDPVTDHDRPLSPNGESLNMFNDRVTRRMNRFADEHLGQTVVACCHGGVISGSLFALTKAERGTVWLETFFTSVTEWERKNDRWHLVRYNDHAHLIGTPLLVG